MMTGLFIGAVAIGGMLMFKTSMEYNPKFKDRVTDYLPWIIVNKNGQILNKNGSITKVYRFKADDMEHQTNYSLFKYRDTINDVLKRLDERFTIHIDSIRKSSDEYPKSKFSEEILKELDNSRKKQYLDGKFYESENYLSITYFPPRDSAKKLESFFYKNDKETNLLEETMERYNDDTSVFLSLMKENLLDLEELTADETVTFLHTCLTGNHNKIKHIRGRLLDSYISDVEILPQNVPVKIGDKYMSVVGILGHIDEHPCGLFDDLSRLGINYRWNTRFIYISQENAIKISEDYQKAYNAQRKSFIKSVQESALSEEVLEESSYALEKKEEASGLEADTRKGTVKSGYYSFNIVLMEEDEKKLKENVKIVTDLISNLGFTVIEEKVNALETFFGTMAGDTDNGLRKPLMTTYNLASLIPINSDWDGNKINKFFEKSNYPSEALIYCQSGENSSYKLNLHVGDVGHTLVLGQTGGGKSVLLNTMAYQCKKYGSRVIFFDNGGSSRVLTRAVGGKFYDIGKNKINFQPLRYIDQISEREWAVEWILSILEKEKYQYTAQDKILITEALTQMANEPEENRTMTLLVLLLQHAEMNSILKLYTKDENVGIYGDYFDNNSDDINDDNLFQVFELEKIFETKILDIFLDYLFHRVETELLSAKNGKMIPTYMFLDEFWRMLGTDRFKARIKNWLKTLRKKHVAVVMATQSLSDVARSDIKSALVESCPTKIYLTNPDLIPNSDTEMDYFSFGLNEIEVEMIRLAQPKRDYYVKSEGGKVISLELTPLELAYVGSSSPKDQQTCEEIYNYVSGDIREFNKYWREYKGV